jgi:hypothetical protein
MRNDAVKSKIAFCLLVAVLAGCAATELEQRAERAVSWEPGEGGWPDRQLEATRKAPWSESAGALLGAIVGTASAP